MLSNIWIETRHFKFDDPFLVPRAQAYELRTHTGSDVSFDIAVVMTGDIEGYVFVGSADEAVAARGIVVSLHDAKGREVHTGSCPMGITTQDPDLERRLDPEVAARNVANYLSAMTMEVTALARACGKSDVHNLEPEDLVALTLEAAAMAQVPLAGTRLIPGQET